MKSKKSAMPIELMITMAMLGILLYVMVYGGIGRLLIPQLAQAGEKSEYATQDCDEDDVIGTNDPCPCVSAIKSKQDKETRKTCGPPDTPKATTNCPALCKIK